MNSSSVNWSFCMAGSPLLPASQSKHTSHVDCIAQPESLCNTKEEAQAIIP